MSKDNNTKLPRYIGRDTIVNPEGRGHTNPVLEEQDRALYANIERQRNARLARAASTAPSPGAPQSRTALMRQIVQRREREAEEARIAEQKKTEATAAEALRKAEEEKAHAAEQTRIAKEKAEHEGIRIRCKRLNVLDRSRKKYFAEKTRAKAQFEAAAEQRLREEQNEIMGHVLLAAATLAEGMAEDARTAAALQRSHETPQALSDNFNVIAEKDLLPVYGPEMKAPVGVIDFGHFKMKFDPADKAKPKVRLIVNGLIHEGLGLGEADYRLLINLYQRNSGATADALGRATYKVATPSSSAYRGLWNIRNMIKNAGLNADAILDLDKKLYSFVRKAEKAAALEDKTAPRLRA